MSVVVTSVVDSVVVINEVSVVEVVLVTLIDSVKVTLVVNTIGLGIFVTVTIE